MGFLPRHLSGHRAGRFRSREDNVQFISTGRVPDRTVAGRSVHAKHCSFDGFYNPIWQLNVSELETPDCGQILAELRKADADLHAAVPSLRDLAASFGRPDGDWLYVLRDLEWKWQDMYFAEHPESAGVTAFDDQRGTVLRK